MSSKLILARRAVYKHYLQSINSTDRCLETKEEATHSPEYKLSVWTFLSVTFTAHTYLLIGSYRMNFYTLGNATFLEKPCVVFAYPARSICIGFNGAERLAVVPNARLFQPNLIFYEQSHSRALVLSASNPLLSSL